MNGIASYAVYSRTLKLTPAEQQAQYGKRTDAQNEIANFKAKAAAAKTPQEFLSDYRSLKFIHTAFDLEGGEQYPARARQILLSDVQDPRSLVNRMSDQRNRVINVAFAFAKTDDTTQKLVYNVDKLKDQTFIDDVVNRYLRASYRGSFNETAPAVSDALYFKQVVKGARSAYQLLSDPGLRDVIMTAGNIPRSAVNLPIDRQAKLITNAFDIKKIDDSAYIEQFIKKYLARQDANAVLQQNSGNTLLGIFA